jgi:hypothetical protein
LIGLVRLIAAGLLFSSHGVTSLVAAHIWGGADREATLDRVRGMSPGGLC